MDIAYIFLLIMMLLNGSHVLPLRYSFSHFYYYLDRLVQRGLDHLETWLHANFRQQQNYISDE